MTAAAIATTATVEAARITGCVSIPPQVRGNVVRPARLSAHRLWPDHPLHERLESRGADHDSAHPAVEELLQLGVPV